ncbi:MAG: heat-inducible transcription repressor HrcA [Ignavibacteriales bacterium]|nr:MAG: heat-inducible transcription repressor HrcA [Ignavibacteriales bacterium]
MDVIELNEREKSILRNIINYFLLTANPVGSRNLTKKYNLGFSPATIRNIMSDLEDEGFLNHPHTSAGRVPTDKGYRYYVDSLMDPPALGNEEKEFIRNELKTFTDETDELFRITSVLLSNITNQLAYVTYPNFDSGILEKLQIVQLTSSRLLVVVAIKLGLVKTITLELKAELNRDHISFVERLLNEKLSGLTFSEIRKTFIERFKDVADTYKPVVRVFIDSADKIFTDVIKNEKGVLTGVKNILKQPEFIDQQHFQNIIELVEDKDIILQFMNETPLNDQVVVKIGCESNSDILSDYSLISKEYKIGDIKGRLGIVGPKRMQYSKVIAIVEFVAERLTEYLKKGSL